MAIQIHQSKQAVRVFASKRNGHNTLNSMQDDTVAAVAHFASCIGEDEVRSCRGRIPHYRVGDRGHFEDGSTALILLRSQTEGLGSLAQKDEPAFRSCKPDSVLKHRSKHIIRCVEFIES